MAHTSNGGIDNGPWMGPIYTLRYTPNNTIEYGVGPTHPGTRLQNLTENVVTDKINVSHSGTP